MYIWVRRGKGGDDGVRTVLNDNCRMVINKAYVFQTHRSSNRSILVRHTSITQQDFTCVLRLNKTSYHQLPLLNKVKTSNMSIILDTISSISFLRTRLDELGTSTEDLPDDKAAYDKRLLH